MSMNAEKLHWKISVLHILKKNKHEMVILNA